MWSWALWIELHIFIQSFIASLWINVVFYLNSFRFLLFHEFCVNLCNVHMTISYCCQMHFQILKKYFAFKSAFSSNIVHCSYCQLWCQLGRLLRWSVFYNRLHNLYVWQHSILGSQETTPCFSLYSQSWVPFFSCHYYWSHVVLTSS